MLWRIRWIIPESFWKREFFNKNFFGVIIRDTWEAWTGWRPLSSAPPEIRERARLAMWGAVASANSRSREVSNLKKIKHEDLEEVILDDSKNEEEV